MVDAEGIEVIDSIAWVHDRLLDRLEVSRKLDSVVVHPTCSSRHLGLSSKLAAIASRISDDVVVPATAGCCGMAGDRGILHPELPASALRDVTRELEGRSFDACVSSNRTCEVALQQVTGRSYASFVLALEAADAGLAGGVPGGSGPPAGLCDTCRHQQLVPNRRGSVFSLCLRSRTEPDRFPALPAAAGARVRRVRAY